MEYYAITARQNNPANQEVRAVAAPSTQPVTQLQPEPTLGPSGISSKTPIVTFCDYDDRAGSYPSPSPYQPLQAAVTH